MGLFDFFKKKEAGRKCSFCGKALLPTDPGHIAFNRLQCLDCYNKGSSPAKSQKPKCCVCLREFDQNSIRTYEGKIYCGECFNTAYVNINSSRPIVETHTPNVAPSNNDNSTIKFPIKLFYVKNDSVLDERDFSHIHKVTILLQQDGSLVEENYSIVCDAHSLMNHSTPIITTRYITYSELSTLIEKSSDPKAKKYIGMTKTNWSSFLANSSMTTETQKQKCGVPVNEDKHTERNDTVIKTQPMKCSFCGEIMLDTDPGHIAFGRIQCQKCYNKPRKNINGTISIHTQAQQDVEAKQCKTSLETIKSLISSATNSLFPSNNNIIVNRLYLDKFEIELFRVKNKYAWVIIDANNGNLFIESKEQRWVGHACYSDVCYDRIDCNKLKELALESESIPEYIFQLNSDNWREILKEKIQQKLENRLRIKTHSMRQSTVSNLQYSTNNSIKSFYISITSSDYKNDSIVYLRMTDFGYKLFFADFAASTYEYCVQCKRLLSFPITEEKIDDIFIKGIPTHDIFDKTLTDADIACIYKSIASFNEKDSTLREHIDAELLICDKIFTAKELSPAFVTYVYELLKSIALKGATLKN